MSSTGKSCVYFNFHGITTLAVEGNDPIVDYLCFQYREFLQSGSDFKADLSLKIVDKARPDKHANYYSEDRFRFYIDNDNFYWSLYGKSVFFKGTDTLASVKTIYCETGFNRIQLNMILELFLRIRFIKSGIALLHAACFSDKNNNAILVPAAKSTGKTALCLNALKAGFEFLSDDRVWLDRQGRIFAFPRYIVITQSNAKHFRAFQGKKNAYRTRFRNIIISITPGTLLKKIMNKVLRRIAPFHAVHYKIQEIYPTVKSTMQANLYGTALLVKDKKSDGNLHPIKTDALEGFISQVANLEWNYTLLNAASIHDMLFMDGPKWHTELQELITEDRSITKEALQGKSNHVIGIYGSAENIDWNTITTQLKKLIIN